MPLKKGDDSGAIDSRDAAASKAASTFEHLSRPEFDRFEKTTETVSARVPIGQKKRLKEIFAANGYTLAEGIKAAIYHFIKHLEKGER